jgi:hypothetical protein
MHFPYMHYCISGLLLLLLFPKVTIETRFNICDMILTLFEINYKTEVWLSKYEITFKLDAR